MRSLSCRSPIFEVFFRICASSLQASLRRGITSDAIDDANAVLCSASMENSDMRVDTSCFGYSDAALILIFDSPSQSRSRLRE